MILEIDNVELTFGHKKILNGVYFKAETGTVTGLLGQNIRGKTSLLEIIFGTLKPKYKNIRLDAIHQKKDLYKTNKITYLPQHQLLPNAIKLKTAFKLFNSDWSDFILRFNSFERHKNSRIHEVSSGELRIIETYLILCSDKEIILLDEPFSFIAPLYIEKIKELINKKKLSSILIITDHFYRDILDISDTIYFIKNGTSKLIQSQRDLENEGYVNIEASD